MTDPAASRKREALALAEALLADREGLSAGGRGDLHPGHVTLDARALDELGPATIDRLADLVANRLAERRAAGEAPLLTVAQGGGGCGRASRHSASSDPVRRAGGRGLRREAGASAA